MGRNKAKEYWEKNIGNWGKFYLEIAHSDEEFAAPRWLAGAYHRYIVPMEARVMSKRYDLTMRFIERYVHAGKVVADIGCGTGIFTVAMLRRGALVKAIDIAENSLRTTRSLVEKVVPEHAHRVEYLQMDVCHQRPPQTDVALAMGVTPYVEELNGFYDNILPTTKVFYCLVIDPKHWANIVRRILPALNVRNLHWFETKRVDELLANHSWRLVDRHKLGTGYLDIAVAPDYLDHI